MTEDVTRSFIVPRELRCFEGHFEGAPVLPAIAQLEMMVLPFVREAFGLQKLRRATRLKFLLPVDPDDTVEVVLCAPSERGELLKVTFKMLRHIDEGAELCAQGTLHFAKEQT